MGLLFDTQHWCPWFVFFAGLSSNDISYKKINYSNGKTSNKQENIEIWKVLQLKYMVSKNV